MTSEPSRSNYSLRKKGCAPQSRSEKSRRTGGAATSHYPSVRVPASSWDTRSQTARPLPEEIAEGKPLERLCSAPRSVIAMQTERWSSLESLCLGFPCPTHPALPALSYRGPGAPHQLRPWRREHFIWWLPCHSCSERS